MKLKSLVILNIIGIFLISLLFHQLYKWFPNKLFSIFFPVNESIWEHLKLIFSSVIFWIIAEYILFKNNSYNNLVLGSLVAAFSTIILFLIIYSPLHQIITYHSFIATLICLLSIVVGQYINYLFLSSAIDYKKYNMLALIIIPIMFTIFGYLTYNPLKNPLFYDKEQDKYGIYNYYS